MSALSMRVAPSVQRKRPFVTRRAFPGARRRGPFSPETNLCLGVTCLATADRNQPTSSLLLLGPHLLRGGLFLRLALLLRLLRLLLCRHSYLLLESRMFPSVPLSGENPTPHLNHHGTEYRGASAQESIDDRRFGNFFLNRRDPICPRRSAP